MGIDSEATVIIAIRLDPNDNIPIGCSLEIKTIGCPSECSEIIYKCKHCGEVWGECGCEIYCSCKCDPCGKPVDECECGCDCDCDPESMGCGCKFNGQDCQDCNYDCRGTCEAVCDQCGCFYYDCKCDDCKCRYTDRECEHGCELFKILVIDKTSITTSPGYCQEYVGERAFKLDGLEYVQEHFPNKKIMMFDWGRIY